MNKNFNKVLKVDLVDMVTAMDEKLTLARGICRGLQAKNKALNEEMFNRAEKMQAMQKEINSLRAYLYPVNETNSESHKAIEYSDSRHFDTTPTDDTKPDYANSEQCQADKAIDDYANKKHQKILDNELKLRGKILTMGQLELLIKLCAQYEFHMPTTTISTLDANRLIDNVLRGKKTNELPKREKPFNPDQLLIAYMRKYPNVYDEVLNRDV